ncbi:MAG: zinc-binding dehydrogenase [Candidatus Nezhaarchaeota archaeon]|nr:zinc-binding dehydrogenase [Candidatus Nezhaarchaeota archaeon]
MDNLRGAAKLQVPLQNQTLSPIEAAPLACSGVTTYRAVREASIDPSKSIAIVGAGGGLGTMAIQIAKAAYGAMVIGVDVRDEALKAAQDAGADRVVDGRAVNAVDEIKKLTDGRGVDAIIDLTCSERTLSTYFALAKGGRYVMVGFHGGEVRYPSALTIFTEAQFIGSFIGNYTDFIGVVSLAERGRIKPSVTKVMRLEEVNEALDNLKHGRIVGRQVLVP